MQVFLTIATTKEPKRVEEPLILSCNDRADKDGSHSVDIAIAGKQSRLEIWRAFNSEDKKLDSEKQENDKNSTEVTEDSMNIALQKDNGESTN